MSGNSSSSGSGSGSGRARGSGSGTCGGGGGSVEAARSLGAAAAIPLRQPPMQQLGILRQLARSLREPDPRRNIVDRPLTGDAR